jgi:hypothetical protein
LRAVVSLGKLSDRRAIPALLRGLTDSNRLVRFRSGEALVALNTDMVPIFQQVVATGDRYGLHAYVTAVENANLLEKLESELQVSASINRDERERLLTVLMSGSLAAEEIAAPLETTKAAARQ